MIDLQNLIAHMILPFVAFATWRRSRLVSAALAIAFVVATVYLLIPWDPLRWGCAGVTGSLGIVALVRQMRLRYQRTTFVPWTPDVLAAMLVGSSVADYVSLWREAHGHPWGALSFWQIVVCLVMAGLSFSGKRPAKANDRESVSRMLAVMKTDLAALQAFKN
jgi:peptidoglycan/LPS O-acetylase OafA/YrhL